MAVVSATKTSSNANTSHSGDTEHKVKTAAKQRYLKAKKNRRKQRAASAKTPAQTKPKAAPAPARDSDADASEGERSPEPPRKRRKVSEERAPEPGSGLDDGDDDDGDSVVGDAIHVDELEPTRPASPLLAFPLPSQPAPPSAETLQRQGLDSALLAATRIEPRTTLALDTLDESVLSERMKKRLRELGVRELFAVQTTLIPTLLEKRYRALYLPFDPPHDICVSAPTGSGKTLAYIVPLVEALSTRVVTRLRALIILPTRDLVSQVREVFEAVARGTGLKCASVTGAQSFVHEQAQLVDKSDAQGSSKVDVLICTPGRLIDHLDGTPHFTLEHLRFLVIDEADRLLAQSFQDWLTRVLSSLAPPPSGASTPSVSDVHAPAFMPIRRALCSGPGADPPPRPSCQKILLSATLTRDPGRLAALGLYRPQYFVVGSGVDDAVGALPKALSEHMVVCEAVEKPLVLATTLRRVLKEDAGQALVFCKSVEAATRLAALLAPLLADAGAGKQVAAYSSDAPRAVLDAFRSRALDVLVCSDLVSRGLDVPSVGAVFNYDAPVDARKFVHRVGRTARAGREGQAWTLLEPQEVRWFKTMLGEIGRDGKLKKVRVAETELAPLRPAYEAALKRLADIYGHKH